MGDSYMEWESQRDEAEEDRGNMGWVLDKGFTLGKRVLVAGFLISSVPIVLPSLFVMSAVGLACSVPYGVLLAGYVCTEKIMSKLLPGSAPSSGPSLEYRAKDGDHEILDAAFTENQPVEKVKMQIDWLEDRDEGKPVEESMGKSDGTAELEKDESSMERRDASMGDVSAVMISIEGEAVSGSNVEEEEAPFEVTGVAVEVFTGVGNENDEELVKETRELIENIRNEGKVENQVARTEQEVVESASKGSSLAREIAVGRESELLDEKNATAQKDSEEVKGELPKKHEETADASKVTVSAAVSKPENRGTSSNKEPDLPPEKKKNKKRVKK